MKKNRNETVEVFSTLLIVAVVLGAVMYFSNKRTNYIMDNCKPNFETQKCEFDTK